jgi:hypothetical protein
MYELFTTPFSIINHSPFLGKKIRVPSTSSSILQQSAYDLIAHEVTTAGPLDLFNILN